MKILLAVDASPDSKHAAHMVEHFDPPPQLSILHVVDIGSLRHAYLTSNSSERDFEAYRQEVSVLSQYVLHTMRDELAPYAAEIRLIADSGDPADSIIQTAEEVQADLILLGCRGMTGTSSFLLGGVSQKVATYAPCSVLVCKTAVPVLDRILIAVDGSKPSYKAATFIAEYPFKSPLQVVLMTVWARPPSEAMGDTLASPPSLDGTAARAKGEDLLQGVLQQFRGGPYKVQIEWQDGDPPAAILESARRHDTQMIVVGARGLKGIKQFLLGSVSQKVLTHATCAVLVVR